MFDAFSGHKSESKVIPELSVCKKAISWCGFLGFFLANMLGHQVVSRIYEQIVKMFGSSAMETFLFWFFPLLAFVVLLIVLPRFRRSIGQYGAVASILAWSIALLLPLFSYAAFILANIEIIHFFQYAIVGCWLMRLIPDPIVAFSIGTFMGAIDEAYNYFFFPMFTKYLDFNDIVLNCSGVMLGIVFFLFFYGPKSLHLVSHRVFARMYFAVYVGLCVFTLMAATGFIRFSIAGSDASSVIVGNSLVLSLKQIESFLLVNRYGKHYHVMTPVEGILALAVMITGLCMLLNWLTYRGLKNVKASPECAYGQRKSS